MSVDFILIPSPRLDAKEMQAKIPVSNFVAKTTRQRGADEVCDAIFDLMAAHAEENQGDLNCKWMEGVMMGLLHALIKAEISLNPALASVFSFDSEACRTMARNLQHRLHRVLISGVAEMANLMP